MIRVWIVAASPVIRAELREMVLHDGLTVAGESADSKQIDLAASHGVDVYLLDGASTTGLGFALASAGSQAVVLLTDQPERVAALRRLRLRGWALLPIDANADAVHAACLASYAGLCVVAPEFAESALGLSDAVETTPLEQPLTAREHGVLELAGRGLPSKMIAAELGVSESTVNFHLSSIFAKLSAASRTEAVSKAARLGLITL